MATIFFISAIIMCVIFKSEILKFIKDNIEQDALTDHQRFEVMQMIANYACHQEELAKEAKPKAKCRTRSKKITE